MQNFEVDDTDATQRRSARFWIGIACGVVVLMLATFGFSVLIAYSTNAFCSCTTRPSSGVYTDYARAVDAFSGYPMPPNERICWPRDHDDDDTPQLYALFRDPIDNSIPWQVTVDGTVCYAAMTVPGASNRTFLSTPSSLESPST